MTHALTPGVAEPPESLVTLITTVHLPGLNSDI